MSLVLTYAIPIPVFKVGLKLPLVTLPTSYPSSSMIKLPDLTMDPASATNPTLICLFDLIFSTASYPMYLTSVVFFLIIHLSQADDICVFSSISFPCRHIPASNLKLSLAPSPAALRFSFYSNLCIISTANQLSILNSNPSSPVYPVLLNPTGIPAIFVYKCSQNFTFPKSKSICYYKIFQLYGPYIARRLFSSSGSILISFP